MARWTVIGLLAALGACSDSDGGGGSGGLALSSADEPSVAPCPSQAILGDPLEFELFRAALLGGTIVHRDVPYDAGDSNIFRKKCGLQGYWDPDAAVNEVAPTLVPVTIGTLFLFENTGICATGFTSTSFGTGEGFPVAGTYRKEFKVSHLGSTWHVRVRIRVSGTKAGHTFASEGILVPDELQNGLVYEVDGVVTAHDQVGPAGIAALAASTTEAPGFTLDVRESGAGPIVFTAIIELICVQKS